jgi:hypothetical protein
MRNASIIKVIRFVTLMEAISTSETSVFMLAAVRN